MARMHPLSRSPLIFYSCVLMYQLFTMPKYCNAGLYSSRPYDDNINTKLDRILSSIEEKLDDLNDKHRFGKLTNSMAVSTENDLQIINHRLQNIEDQIARAESFNRLRLDKIFESIQKEEFLVEQLAHKIDKNQQQLNSRFAELETELEKLTKSQEDFEKDIRKANKIQSDLSSSVEEVTENMEDIKLLATESFQNLNTSQQTFHQHLLNMIINASNHEEITDTVKKLGEQLVNSTAAVNGGILKCTQGQQNDAAQYISPKEPSLNGVQKDINGESSKLIATIDNMYNDLRQQTQSIESLSKESLGISNKIYTKMDTENQDMSDLYDSFVESAVQEITTMIHKKTNQLYTKIKQNFEMILVEQHGFMDNCHRLQLNEDQVENRVAAAMEDLVKILQNKTNGIDRVEELLKQVETHEVTYNMQVEEMNKFIRSQSNHITRNIAHATNKIIEMEKTSKQLQISITSVKDTCSNLSLEMQDMNKDINVLTQLIEKEYILGPEETTELPEIHPAYNSTVASSIAILTQKPGKQSTVYLTTKEEELPIPLVIHQATRDATSPSLIHADNAFRYNGESGDHISKIRHFGNNLSKIMENLRDKSRNIPEDRNKFYRISTQLDHTSKENTNLLDINMDYANVSFIKDQYNPGKDNISEVLKYFKSSKFKIKTYDTSKLTLNDSIAADHNDDSRVFKFSNELTDNLKSLHETDLSNDKTIYTTSDEDISENSEDET